MNERSAAKPTNIWACEDYFLFMIGSNIFALSHKSVLPGVVRLPPPPPFPLPLPFWCQTISGVKLTTEYERAPSAADESAKRAVNVSMCNPRKHTFCMEAHILYTWTQIVLQRHTHCVLFIRYACMLVYIGVYEDRWINDVAGCIT